MTTKRAVAKKGKNVAGVGGVAKAARPQMNNVNRHTPRGISELEKSIQRDGWIGAVTVAKDGEAFDGSARVETLMNVMPDAEPIVIETDGTRPVVVVRTDIDTANDTRAKRLAVAANSIASMGWNPDAAILAAIAREDEAVKHLLELDDMMRDAVVRAARAEQENAIFDATKQDGGNVSGVIQERFMMYITFRNYQEMFDAVKVLNPERKNNIPPGSRIVTIDGSSLVEGWKKVFADKKGTKK